MLIHIFGGLTGGLVIGWLQSRMMMAMVQKDGLKRYLLLMLKLVLWGGSMTLLVLLSIPALLSFALSATAAMLVTAARMYQHKKEV